MFRMRARESAEAAKAYYTEKARQDYYSEGQEILGNWGGKGAERLGLKGTVGRRRVRESLRQHQSSNRQASDAAHGGESHSGL